MNDQSDFGQSDPFDFAVTQPLQKVAGAADDNPDDAARSVDLSKSTGVPAPIINEDLEGFEKVHKASLSNQIMRSNPALIDYVRNHPMAASVSNDDWGALAEVSQAGSKLHSLLQADPAHSAGAGAISGAEEGFMQKTGLEQSIDDWYGDKPLAWALMNTAMFPAEGLIRGFNALMGAQFGALKGGAEAAYKAITGDAEGAKDFGQSAVENANVILAGSMADAGEASGLVGQMQRQREAYTAAKPWLDANLVPPRGVHPVIDDYLTDINAEAVKRLDAVLSAAQGSSTHGRSVEMFKDFVSQQHADATIGIHGDAVAALYGDKPPAPGDGLLGFVPNMGDQLLSAAISGNDIHVPIKDWVSQVDPQVAQQLHDDIRMFPGGITAREAQTPFEPTGVVEAPLAQVRGAAGMEPSFALGDRKLILEPDLDANSLGLGDNYKFMTPRGEAIGQIRLWPDPTRMELNVDWVGGLNEHGMTIDIPNGLGPAAVRDVLRQLKDKYPGYTLTGDRVTGARSVSGGGSVPQIKLALDKVPSGWDKVDAEELQKTDDTWRQLSEGTFAKPAQAMDMIVQNELRRIVGDFPELLPASEIRTGGIKTPIRGVMQPKVSAPPIIAWNALLNPETQIGVARHEAIHYLRQYGFFKPEEWAELGYAAIKNGWLDKYDINTRYAHLPIEPRIEEAVAEAYRHWASRDAEPVVEPTSKMGKAFQRMKDLWDGMVAKIKDVFGGRIDPEELFKQINSGQIARRGVTSEPGHPSLMMPSLAIDDEAFQNLKANATGLDAKSYKRLQDAIKARYQSDLTEAVARAERQQKQSQSAEWRLNRIDVRKEVERTIKQRPDVAADLFVNSGEYEGSKLRQRIPLKAGDLSDEQKQALPNTYYSRDGLPVSDVARLFGYQDGQHLVERLTAMAQARGERTPQEHLKSLIEGETQLQMERKYGKLEDNIMEAASDQALSDTDINLLAEEYHAAGMLAGQATIDKNVIKSQVQEAFSKMPLSAVSSQRLMAEMGRHGRDAERALIPGQENPAAALVSMERKLYTGMMAAEARKLEKQIAAFDKTAKRLSKREVTSLPQPYTNFIHQILSQVGKPIQRTAGDLRTEIANHAGENTLEDFVTDLQNSGQEPQVWDQLFTPDWTKPYKELSVDEFRNVKDSVDSLNFIGRAVGKVEKAGVKEDLEAIKSQLVDSLKSFGEKHYDIEGGRWMGPLPPSVATLPRTALANSLTLETVMGRWDRGDKNGPWTQWAIRPLIEAASDENVVKREFAGKLRAIYEGEVADPKMKDPVHNPLFRDTIGGSLYDMDRSNLRAVMLNTGSRGGVKSNLTKLAKGYGLKEDDILAWIDQHATKEDWDWCQKIWGLYGELWDRAQRMRRSLNGVGAKSLSVPPIQTPFGEYEGGYYPILYRDQRQSAKSLNALFDPSYTRATTFDGYAQERTGAFAPVHLTLDPMPNHIGQMIHDITMRPAVLNAAKLFYDSDIKTAISRYYGKEYSDLLVPYLRDVANVSNFQSQAQTVFGQLLSAVQKNLVVSLIGANIGTVMKHGPTAFVTSLNEVGPLNFLDAVKDMIPHTPTGNANIKFAMERSEELQNRQRNWVETLTGTSGEFVPGQSMGQARQKIAELGSWAVAKSDMMSAAPTWMASYRKAIKDGETEGDAKFSADRAVRRAHGSSSITNRAGVQRILPSMLTSFYTFFNDILNRQAETVWKAADALGAVKDYRWADAKAALPGIAGGLFATVVWPAIVEQLVSPTGGTNESWEKKAAKGLAHSLTSSWIGVRDFANWIIEGHDPSLGLFSTAFHELGDAINDMKKEHPLSKEHAGKVIKDSAGLAGVLSGLVPLAVGKAAEFTYGTAIGHEHPQGPWGWAVGLRYGTLQGHSPTFERWRKGK